MKISINLFIFVTLTALMLRFQSASAQAPQAVPYQAVARDNTGATLTNQSISLRLSIRNATATGSIVYQETQNTTTNNLGLFTLNIGQGTPLIGTIDGVNWSSGSKFIQIEFDPAGGTTYLDMGTTQLMSVPYALYALKSGTDVWEQNGDNVYINNPFAYVGIGTGTPTSKLNLVDEETSSETKIKFENTYNGYSNSAAISLQNNSGGGGFRALQFSNLNPSAPSNSTAFLFNTNQSPSLLTLTYGGNVGIGTALPPAAKLEVNGTIKITDGSQGTGKVLTSDANGLASWATPTGLTTSGSQIGNTPYWDGTTWVTSSSNIFNNGGNVGIGTSTPSSVLEVNGDAKINGIDVGRGSGPSLSLSTRLGTAALVSNTNGSKNTALGNSTLYSNTTGSQSTAIGTSALYANTTGWGNVATGFDALRNNTTGQHNSATGDAALKNNITGSSNTALGANADVASGNLSNATAIGANAIVSSSNSLVLGSNANVGIGTSSPAAKLDVNGAVKITDGTQGAGKVLTSDSNGVASWITPGGTLSAGSQAGNTPYWDGTQWVSNNNNIFNNGGNIGIGTSTPSTKLNIYSTNDPEMTNNPPTGGLSITSNADVNLIMGAGSTGTGWIQNRSNILSGPVYYPLSLQPLGGSVGIGTDNPTYKLHVMGSSNITGGLFSPHIAVNSSLSDATNGSPWFGIGYSNLTLPGQSQPATQVSGYYGLNFIDRGGNMVFSNGKLGVGTNNPQAPFHLSSTSTAGHIAFNGAQVDCKIGTDGVNDLWIDNATLTNLPAKSISFKTAGSTKMIVRGNGNIGIGTTNPLAPLHVNTATNVSPGNTYLYNGNGVGGSYSGSHSTSILASSTIVAGNFAATSDARIKQVIGISNSTADLELLNKIKITDYTYIDKVANGTGITKKVIAQEVEQILPNAVNKNINFIPNVYALATKTALVHGTLQLTLAKEHTVKTGDKLKWIDEQEQEHQNRITAIINANTIEIDYTHPCEQAFVYGVEVNDFRTVDYEAIAMLNVSATQELLKRIESLEKENGQLKESNIILKEMNATNNAKMSTIEAKLNLLLQTSAIETAQK